MKVIFIATYTYKLPKLLASDKMMPIENEQQQIIGYLRKKPEHVLYIIANLLLENGLPSTYEVFDLNNKLLFTINPCLLNIKTPYQLTLHEAGEVIQILSKKVQLIEVAYHFTLGDQHFRFEKDFTSTAHLYCNEERIASAHYMDDGQLIPPVNKEQVITMTINQTDDYFMPALIAILYHSLFLFK